MTTVIVGDIMIDINYISEVKRNAPEADIPIYNILEVHYKLGGASNVANNLNNLDKNTILLSIVGNDHYAEKTKCLLDEKNIKNMLFIDNDRKTTQKHRIFLNDKLHVRYDIEDTNDISVDFSDKLFEYISSVENLESIIISDYDKGLITDSLCKRIIKYSNEKNILTFIDPKIKNCSKYSGCFLFKPNQHEAEIISNETTTDNILTKIKHIINCNNILLTRGSEGMILNDNNNKIQHDRIVKLVDVTGAGDIVMAVLVYSYKKYNDLLLSSKIANYVAGKSVGYIGNYEISENDINEYFISVEQTLTFDKIIFDNEHNKINLLSKNKNIVFTNGCFDILHSAHIELLKFAKSQGDILVVGLNSDESIKRLKGDKRPINDIYERSKILSLFDFIDFIIVFNDDTPLNIIKLLKPDILVKGSDYNMENIVGKEVVKNIIFFNLIKNKSSTRIINKIKDI
jgi:D-beta-D-heptose 7-phosphate kinase/D-beta-D-heptose 1-phosphate adenosyltransferase